MKKVLAGVAFVGMISLAGSACSSTPVVQEKENEQRLREELARDVADEMAVGKQIAARLLGRFGYEPMDAESSRYVNLVGQTLAQQSGRPELEYHFGILHDDEINAFAAPGGYIFVTRGLLRTLRSESELAVVLAHEIAHVNERHMYNEIAPKRQSGSEAALVNLMSRGKTDLGASMSRIVSQGLKMLLEDGLGREKEYAADEAGVLYATQAGYDATSLAGLLSRIDRDHAGLKVGKTHPPYPERLKSLKECFGRNGVKPRLLADESGMKRRFVAAMSTVRGGIEE